MYSELLGMVKTHQDQYESNNSALDTKLAEYQSRGTYLLLTVLRIWDVYPGSEFFPSRIRFFPSRIRIKVFEYFNPKKGFLSSWKYDLGCSSGIRNLTFYPSWIPDPGSGSATLTASTSCIVKDPAYLNPYMRFWVIFDPASDWFSNYRKAKQKKNKY